MIEDPYSVATDLRRLLLDRDPVRIVIDDALPSGAWYIVRAMRPSERAVLDAASYGGTE